MKQHLKNFFIPHEGNDYHPHILHTKRAVFYGAFFVLLKGMVVLFAVLIPSVVFVMPDVLAQEEVKLVNLTNSLRLQKGIAPMESIVPLHVSSDYKAHDMADLHYFSHTSPQKYGLAHFLAQAGYSYDTAGENLAMGFSSAEDIFKSWVKSPTHYANLIDPDFSEFGIAMEAGTYDNLDTVYVAQHFGHPKTPVKESFPESNAKDAPLTSPATTTPKAPVLKLAVAPRTKTPTATTTPAITATATSTPISPLSQIIASLVATSSPEDAGAVSTSTFSDLAVGIIENAISPLFEAKPLIASTSSIALVPEGSSVAWKEVAGGTEFSVVAKLDLQNTEVFEASVQIQDSVVLLKKDAGNVYRGSLTVAVPVDTFFDPIVEPTLVIVEKNGDIFTSPIKWETVKFVAPTPLEKYTRAKEIHGVPESVFAISRMIYLVFAGFFSLALLLMICIEIRRQHHHIIAQTLGLILLIVSLFLV